MYILFISENDESCDDSYRPLIWWILIFFLVPLIPLNFPNKWVKRISFVVAAVALVYVPFKYAFTDGCANQGGMRYFILSAILAAGLEPFTTLL